MIDYGQASVKRYCIDNVIKQWIKIIEELS